MTTYQHVAIDGPVASGKTTAARAVSRRLGLLYLDTGAMYRAIALAAVRSGVDPANEKALLRLTKAEPITVELDSDAPLGFRIRIGPTEVGPELFASEVSAVVSIIATHPGVRAEMVKRQRDVAKKGAVVMAGRDIGTVVLPDAPHKIFLTASVDARVARRRAELADDGTVVDFDVLRAQIEARDQLDANRPVAPLRPAEGATIIDSSHLDQAEVVARIVGIVTQEPATP